MRLASGAHANAAIVPFASVRRRNAPALATWNSPGDRAPLEVVNASCAPFGDQAKLRTWSEITRVRPLGKLMTSSWPGLLLPWMALTTPSHLPFADQLGAAPDSGRSRRPIPLGRITLSGRASGTKTIQRPSGDHASSETASLTMR